MGEQDTFFVEFITNLHLINMKAFYLILFIAFSVCTFAQPGNKGGAQAHYILQEAKSTRPPYEQKLLDKIDYTKDELNRFLERPDLKEPHLLKAHYYLAAFERVTLDHKVSTKKADTSDISLYLDRCRTFIGLETKETKWLNRQKQIKEEVNQMMFLSYQASATEENFETFSNYSETRNWYHTQLEDQRIDSLYSSLNNEPDPNVQLEILNSFEQQLSVYYDSFYSNSNYPSLDKKRIAIEKAITNKKLEDERKALLAEERRQAAAKRLKNEEKLMHRADSLLELKEYALAKEIYQEVQSKSPTLALRASKMVKEIDRTIFEEERAKVTAYVYQNYLYDSLGRLRLDSSVQIGTAETEQIKNKRTEIARTLIDQLRQYDADQMKKYHKGDMTFQEFRSTLPNQITSTTKHLYRLEVNGDSILSIQHQTLEGDSINALLTHQLLSFTLPKIAKTLQLSDNQTHTYYLPILYIPNRYSNPHFYYFCNCQNLGGYSKIKCEDQHTKNTKFIDSELYLSEHDELFFLVTEGRSSQVRAD